MISSFRARVSLTLPALFFCGFLSGLALIVSALWPLAFCALVPLLFASKHATNGKRAFFYGCLWGAGFMGTVLSYFFAMLPFDWLGIASPTTGPLAAFIGWLILTTLLSVPIGLYALLMRALRNASPWLLLVGSPLAWVALEVARATLYSLALSGAGTAIGPYFTFGYLGYAFAWALGLLALAPIGGPLFLSGCVVLCNTALFLVVSRVAQPVIRLSVTIGFLLTLLVCNAALPPAVRVERGGEHAQIASSTVALVHADFDARLTTSSATQRAQDSALGSAIVHLITRYPETDLVVLPEDSRFVLALTNATTTDMRAARSLLEQHAVLLVDSTRVMKQGEARGIVYAYDTPSRAFALTSSKSYLVPFGEYVPYAAAFAARIFGFDAALQRLAVGRASYVTGEWIPESRLLKHNGVTYGLLSCSELLYPYYMRDLSDAGADAIVLLSSQSWIRSDSSILFNQMLAMAIVDSAWITKPYLQATNRAPNVIITPR